MHLMKHFGSALGFVALAGCEQSSGNISLPPANYSNAEFRVFLQEVKENFVFVKGGEFLMGDFGTQYAPEKLPYDVDSDSKPLHKVVLSDYSISRFKVTNSMYQFYLSQHGLNIREMSGDREKWDSINSLPNTPAHVDWYEAEKYCNWLGSITDLPIALPTEAQWEYAARSRGQYLIVATNDGTYKAEPRSIRTEKNMPKGINISSNGDRVTFAKENALKTNFYTPLPVDLFPPNPLGLYAMSDNGYEWVKDWYDPKYYELSPLNDPQGPVEPSFKDRFGRSTKVLRGQNYADPDWGGAVNIFRKAEDPYGRFGEEGFIYIDNKTMRCAVNSSTPVAAR
jgi:formylglycine-generating enzyme required for sulfatase activity